MLVSKVNIQKLNSIGEIFEYKHSDIQNDILDKIIELKNVVWPYGYEEHKRWVQEYMQCEDIHYCFFLNNLLVGYFFITNVHIEKDQIYKGISNVCVSPLYRRNNIGTVMINQIVKNSNEKFILLTKKNNFLFYKNNGFKEFNGNVYVNNKILIDSKLFYYNFIFNNNSIILGRGF